MSRTDRTVLCGERVMIVLTLLYTISAMAFMLAWLMPETRGLSLEELEKELTSKND